MRINRRRKDDLSADAKILIALIKKQPLSTAELIDKSKVSPSQFYRRIPILNKEGIVKKICGKYAFAVGGYSASLVELDSLFRKLVKKKYPFKTFSLSDLAYEVQKPESEIKDAAYKLTKKYNYKIGLKTSTLIGLYLHGMTLADRYGDESTDENLVV